MRLGPTMAFVALGVASGMAAAAPLGGLAVADPRTDRMAFARPHSLTVISDPDVGVWSVVTYPWTFLSPFAMQNRLSTLSAFHLVGSNGFMTGSFTLQSSLLTLRLPKVFGLEPFAAGGAAGGAAFTNLGLGYTLGHFQVGTRVALSRIDPTSAHGDITSMSFVRYTDDRMSLDLSHWTALAMIGSRPATTIQSMSASVGMAPRTDGSSLYASLLVPLKGLSTTHVTAFGVF